MKIQSHKGIKMLLGATLALGLSLTPALALPSVSIYSNSGGRIIDYALQAAKFREAHKLVQFTGQCDSACTLFLALPRHQVCVAPGANFRFHAPTSSNTRAAYQAKQYLLRKYPGWVRSFIAQRGGLTGNLITMNYSVASRFLPHCGSSVASR